MVLFLITMQLVVGSVVSVGERPEWETSGSQDWRITVTSANGNGNQIQITEMALLDSAASPLGGNPTVDPTPSVNSHGAADLSHLNDGDFNAGWTNINPLPVIFSYSGVSTLPHTLQFQGGDNARTPKNIKVGATPP